MLHNKEKTINKTKKAAYYKGEYICKYHMW